MEIKVLGPGCPKCKSTMDIVKKVVSESGIPNITIEKVDDIVEIMKYNIIATPAIVVDGVVKLKGKVPNESEIKAIIQQ
jgi:small redox-active disulfide protein 2